MQYGLQDTEQPANRSQAKRRQVWKTQQDEAEIIHRRNLAKLKRDIQQQLRENGEIDYAVLNRPTEFTSQIKNNNARMNRQILTYIAPIGKRQNPESVKITDRRHNQLYMSSTQRKLAQQQSTQREVQKVIDEAQTIRDLRNMQQAFQKDYNNYMKTIRESKRWK